MLRNPCSKLALAFALLIGVLMLVARGPLAQAAVILPAPVPVTGPGAANPTQVTNVSVQPNPSTPGASSTYTVSFTTSSSGALGQGATITIVAPPSTSFLAIIANYRVAANNGHVAAVGNVAVSQVNGSATNNSVTLTLSSSTIASGDTVAVTLQGAVNPSAGSYTATAATSADTLPATSATYTIAAAAGPTPAPGATLTPTPTPSLTPTATPITVATVISTVSPVQTPVPTQTPAPATPQFTVSAGFNLVAGPAGTVLGSAIGPFLYTLKSGDSAYEMLPTNTSLQPGQGYWALFDAKTTIALPLTTGVVESTMIQMPAGHWIMVGNPFDIPVTVVGADFVDTYDPAHGYTQQQQAVRLNPGQGAMVFSFNGGVLTLNPVIS